VTPYTDRRNAGHYDDPTTKKTKTTRPKGSTTSDNLSGLSTGKTKTSKSK